ncbi:MlaD family protein [Candidatus Aalborgicola defluviihabitans]|uniref:MlaD family protein n=1 Tax=Candidatus Aalborgicola defluviihabitans TaxID=3386187 RepID=UPI001EC25E1D|nr:MCE family protein [Burkholderiales bacterium]
MEDKLNPAIVGAFVLVLGAALIAGVLWLAAGMGGQKSYFSYRSVLAESVAGLNVDAPVKYLGVDVGKVRSIAIDPQNSRQVMLGFLIERGTPVKQDSEAVLKAQGLTGIVYVELSGGSPGSPALLPTREEPVPLIPSKPSLSTRLENVLGTVLAGLDQMSGNLSAVFDADNRLALKTILSDTASLTTVLAQQKEAIRAGVADAARTAHLTAQASAQLDPLLKRITAASVALENTAQTVDQVGKQWGTTADAATGGLQQIRSETLPELSRLVAELNQLSSSLRQLTEQTKRTPSSLLLGGPTRPAGPGESPQP